MDNNDVKLMSQSVTHLKVSSISHKKHAQFQFCAIAPTQTKHNFTISIICTEYN